MMIKMAHHDGCTFKLNVSGLSPNGPGPGPGESDSDLGLTPGPGRRRAAAPAGGPGGGPAGHAAGLGRLTTRIEFRVPQSLLVRVHGKAVPQSRVPGQ